MYDVIVVGGGPIGLAAAYQCAKEHKKVLVIEQFNFGNEHGSSAGYSRQFRICYSEKNLCDLAVKASTEWDKLMAELNNYTLMQRSGTLWFGDSSTGGSGSPSEGNIDEAIVNLKALCQDYTELTDRAEIAQKYPFIAAAVEDIDSPKALFVPDGGTVNVPGLVQCLYGAIGKFPGCKLIKSTCVTSIDHSAQHKILVETNDEGIYHGKKVILTPGTYVNHVLATLKPAYPKVIDFDIYLWASTYFKIGRAAASAPVTWPTWYFFGNPKSMDEPMDVNLYYGFPTEGPTPIYARVSPAFTSGKIFDFHLYPPPMDNRPIDHHALKFTSDFVQRSMPDLKPSSVDKMETNCVAGFAKRLVGKEDNSGGIVLDFVPETSNRIVLTAGGWCMKYVPVMGIILAQMALHGKADAKYIDSIEPMNINRGVLIDVSQAKSKTLTCEQRAKKLHKLWF